MGKVEGVREEHKKLVEAWIKFKEDMKATLNNPQQLKPRMMSKDEFVNLAMDNAIGGESAGYCYDLFAHHFGH
jgi:hypothetical protein